MNRDHVETLPDVYTGGEIRITATKADPTYDVQAMVYICREGSPLSIRAEELKSALDRLGVL